MDLAKENKKIVIFLSLALLLLGPVFAWSADLSLATAKSTYEVGEIIPVKIYLNSPGQASNAVSGTLSFSSAMGEVSSLSKIGSVINMWVAEPAYFNKDGQANFEGVVLNPGFSGAKGLVLTVNLRPKSTGTLKLSFANGSILANDGQGTNILNKLGRLDLTIIPASKKEGVVETPTSKSVPVERKETKVATTSKSLVDIISPEQLSIVEISSPSADQAKFSFSASDAGSGLSHFQFFINDLSVARLSAEENIFETNKLEPGWYELTISAFDKAGNETQERINFEIKSVFALANFLDKINISYILFGLFVFILLVILILILQILIKKLRSVSSPIEISNRAFSGSSSITFVGTAIGSRAVILMHNGQISAEAGPGPTGSFEFSLNNISAGLHHFSLVAEEALGNPTYTYNYPVMLSSGASVRAIDIVLKLPPLFSQKSVENSYKKDINYNEPNV